MKILVLLLWRLFRISKVFGKQYRIYIEYTFNSVNKEGKEGTFRIYPEIITGKEEYTIKWTNYPFRSVRFDQVHFEAGLNAFNGIKKGVIETCAYVIEKESKLMASDT